MDQSFNWQEFLLKLPAQYPYEAIASILILIYIQMYFLGNSKNKQLALKFVNATNAYFQENFAHIGITKQANGPLLTADSASSFKFFASGRINVYLMMITIELKKRQDLLYTFLFSFIWPEKDLIQIDIPLTAQQQPIAFALIKKREAKNYKENNIDLKYLTEKVNIDRIEEKLHTLILLGEGREPLNTILDNGIIKTLSKYEKYIQVIHFSDQKNLYANPAHLRAVIVNFQQLQSEELCELTHTILAIADKLSNYKLSNSLKSANEEERAKLEEIKQKDEKLKKIEEAQKKKAEKLQKEKQKLYSLPREQQIKIQEKEKRDELKKRYQKKTMFM